jgi:hypothetical protein
MQDFSGAGVPACDAAAGGKRSSVSTSSRDAGFAGTQAGTPAPLTKRFSHFRAGRFVSQPTNRCLGQHQHFADGASNLRRGHFLPLCALPPLRTMLRIVRAAKGAGDADQ